MFAHSRIVRRLVALALLAAPLFVNGCANLTRPDADSIGPVGQAEIAGGTPTPKPAEAAPAASALPDGRIQAAHILVSFKGSRGPNQTRTKEEARGIIDGIIARLKKGEDFGKLAAEFGEDGTKARGGDLGVFGRGQMVKAFEDAVFGLKAGETSGVVETEFGFHVVKRTR
jgi:parvulin-like peptidyl-prolyl isomerase